MFSPQQRLLLLAWDVLPTTNVVVCPLNAQFVKVSLREHLMSQRRMQCLSPQLDLLGDREDTHQLLVGLIDTPL